MVSVFVIASDQGHRIMKTLQQFCQVFQNSQYIFCHSCFKSFITFSLAQLFRLYCTYCCFVDVSAAGCSLPLREGRLVELLGQPLSSLMARWLIPADKWFDQLTRAPIRHNRRLCSRNVSAHSRVEILSKLENSV